MSLHIMFVPVVCMYYILLFCGSVLFSGFGLILPTPQLHSST